MLDSLGLSCASLPPQYQISCYNKRCHEAYTFTQPVVPQKSPEDDEEDYAGVAPEYQLNCYRKNCHEVCISTVLESAQQIREPTCQIFM